MGDTVADSSEAPIAAVVVDYNVGPPLAACVESLLADGAAQVVVVENGFPGSSAAGLGRIAERVTIISMGENLGFGGGVNRGVAGCEPTISLILVANPDTETHPGALPALRSALVADSSLGIVGPEILTPQGDRYPSVRRFPSMTDAVGHALIGLVSTNNRFSRRYRSAGERPGGGVDWISGAYFAISRTCFEDLGGFDEGYFMFAEDMDLCWRAHEAGYGVDVVSVAQVTHVEGVSRRAHPYRMLVAHHRSAWRFAVQTTKGPRRVFLPLAAVVLGGRLAGALGLTALRARPQT
jgi:N-acetylglucosaminyl-diphospho-decaprenol L-rhamnosyltransferase